MEAFKLHWIMDILDVFIVSFLFYRLFLLIKGTRAAQMFSGLVLIVFASLVAQWLQLRGVNWIVSSLKTVWVVAFVILFQPELRKALAQLGQYPLLDSLVRTQPYGILGEVAKAAEELASKKEGALIVLERQVGLKTYVETGTRLDARASAELIVTVFTPPSPLHDGALIIRGDRVVAAGCILPLTQNPALSKSLGTRHRAALGLSEESDALVLVVSEETRQISVAIKGTLRRVKDTGALLSELSAVYGRAPVDLAEEPEPWLDEANA